MFEMTKWTFFYLQTKSLSLSQKSMAKGYAEKIST